MQLFFYLFNKIKEVHGGNPKYWEYYHDIYFCNSIKFNMLTKYVENNDETFMNIFSTIQKMMKGFSRLAYIYRLKRATIKNSHDLGLNPISNKNPRKTIAILQDSSIYIMSLQELIQIINAELSYVNGFFILESHLPKNPYTNTKFNKSTLYNIYFAVKQSDYKMPPLFHSFFLHHFNLIEFYTVNNAAILEYAIHRHVYKSHPNTIYANIIEMLANHTLTNGLQMSKDFPKDVLADIMRPYLHIYFRVMYSNLSAEDWFNLSGELTNNLTKFYIYNPKFGRKYIYTKKRSVTFNTDHIKFDNPMKRMNLIVSF